eukprot:scaffold92360_cov28-Tisochrysis_lutea.AAC.5
MCTSALLLANTRRNERGGIVMTQVPLALWTYPILQGNATHAILARPLLCRRAHVVRKPRSH